MKNQYKVIVLIGATQTVKYFEDEERAKVFYYENVRVYGDMNCVLTQEF